MPNVSRQQFMPGSTDYAQLGHSSVRVNKSLEGAPSASVGNLNTSLKDGRPASTEHTVSVNKESLEKLFALFEFAVKAMRSLLAGMGRLPSLAGELEAQHPVTPGPDAKVAPDADAQPQVMSSVDNQPQVRPGVQRRVSDRSAQVTLAPGGKLNTQLTPDINVTVQVQTCHCPHTDEGVAPQAQPALKVDSQPSPPPPLTLTPLDLQSDTRPTPDLSRPAPHETDDFNRHSGGLSGNPRAARPSLRSRF